MRRRKLFVSICRSAAEDKIKKRNRPSRASNPHTDLRVNTQARTRASEYARKLYPVMNCTYLLGVRCTTRKQLNQTVLERKRVVGDRGRLVAFADGSPNIQNKSKY